MTMPPEKSSGQEVARRNALNAAVRSTWQWKASALSIGESLRCLLAMGILLALGLIFRNPVAGAVAASGALTAGFGSFQRLRRSRAAPMLLGSFGTALSALIGSFAGHSAIAFPLVVGVLAFGSGLLAALSEGIWWIGLQCVVFAIIASNYPVGIASTLTRAGLILSGGLLQTLIIVLFWRFERKGPATDAADALEEIGNAWRLALQTLRDNISPFRSEIGREALRLALTAALSAGISRLIPLPNAYWMPMTTVIVMKADLHQTLERSLSRTMGTLLGAGLATLLATTLRPGPPILAIFVLIFAGLCFTLLRVNYALYAVCITAFVAFQLALLGLPEIAVVKSRLLYTALGGALALLTHLLRNVSRTPSRQDTDAV